ncbi:SRPBCC family protein [Streptacidiphilus pinicola]|uniref:SRPBCC family protein n=1 Tax=Streptacidiphilus pinicola TaxID=2219663 RepID=A0A2X0J5P6_9ACTN|nr:SRPBCC family protein [Streptacidiphilus pinicola]RAG82718.1 SRPBCC family protein [Streptacidiphilus pinicola]
MRARARQALGTGALAAVAAGAAYPWLWRYACLTWGASAVEVCRAMPGDELLPAAPLVTTRAVTVDTWPSAAWPWLIRQGPGRGGAYTYAWIETVFGLDRRIPGGPQAPPPELKPGDLLPLSPRGPVLEVVDVDVERGLVLSSQDGRWVWSFGLYPRGHSTRLVSRNRIAPPDHTPAARLFSLYVLEPVGLLMERRMLLGVKKRAEAEG